MHRATPANTSFRAFCAGGSRTCIHAIDDLKQLQEMGGNMMAGENRSKVESPQNYGFTSVVHNPIMDKLGKVTSCAEGFMSFMGGNRSFPVCAIMDDRRHRLTNLLEGDVAMFRGAADQLQFHLAQTGGFWTGPNSKKLRMQLIQPQQQQQSQQPGQMDASGGAGSDAGGGQQQQMGQKPVYQQDSKQFFELNNDMTQIVNKAHQLLLQDQKTGIEVASDNNVYLGRKSNEGQFLQVMLIDGSAAQNTFALKSSLAAAADSDGEPAGPAPIIQKLLDAIEKLEARVGALEAAWA